MAKIDTTKLKEIVEKKGDPVSKNIEEVKPESEDRIIKETKSPDKTVVADEAKPAPERQAPKPSSPKASTSQDKKKKKATKSKRKGFFSKKKKTSKPEEEKPARSHSINLIPGPTEQEVVYEETTTKRSISGFLFIAFVVFVAVVILGFNLYTKIRLNSVQQRVAETENEITLKQLEEVQMKNLNNKLDAYSAVKGQDFNSNNVLEYLLETTEGLSDVKSLYLDNSMEFEVRGSASSYTNVARLWHDMSREQEYFESISLNRVSRSSETGTVQFVFSGFMIKEKVITL